MKKTICMLGLVLVLGAKASGGFDTWYNSDKWDVVGDAALNPKDYRRLVGRPGTGVLINGKEGKCPSLVSKRRDYREAKGSNSGVIFHGNHEIQILDSYGIRNPNAGHCGGVYPRAENQPTYHHIDKGSPPRINAARRPGRWQIMDIVFQAARFDKHGNKTAHARFVKVVHNGVEIQRDVEVPYACGPNWDRQQYPQGPIIIQGDYGPIAVRNLRIKEWQAGTAEKLNFPLRSSTAGTSLPFACIPGSRPCGPSKTACSSHTVCSKNGVRTWRPRRSTGILCCWSISVCPPNQTVAFTSANSSPRWATSDKQNR